MSRLIPEMYGSEFKSVRGLFDLSCGQMRCREKFGHNSGWYNEKGEKIGWGDLDRNDIINITEGLEENEIFIILSESDSFWNFVEKSGDIGSMSETKPTEKNPGLKYVIEKCKTILTKGKVRVPSEFSEPGIEIRNNLTIEIIDRKTANKIIRSYS